MVAAVVDVASNFAGVEGVGKSVMKDVVKDTVKDAAKDATEHAVDSGVKSGTKEGTEAAEENIAKASEENAAKETSTPEQSQSKTTDSSSKAAEDSSHGNTLNDKPAEGYTLRDRGDSSIVKKYGETTRGEDNFGAGNQKRYSKKFLKENNVFYWKEISGTKKEMLQWQHDSILEYKAQNGGKRPDLNKSDY